MSAGGIDMRAHRPAWPSPFTSPAARLLPMPSYSRSLCSKMHRDAGRAVTLVVKLVGAAPVPSTMKLRAIP